VHGGVFLFCYVVAVFKPVFFGGNFLITAGIEKNEKTDTRCWQIPSVRRRAFQRLEIQTPVMKNRTGKLANSHTPQPRRYFITIFDSVVY